MLTSMLNAPPPTWQRGRIDTDGMHKARYAAGQAGDAAKSVEGTEEGLSDDESTSDRDKPRRFAEEELASLGHKVGKLQIVSKALI